MKQTSGFTATGRFLFRRTAGCAYRPERRAARRPDGDGDTAQTFMIKAQAKAARLSVVFLHGMFGAPENWDAAAAAVRGKFQSHTPRLPMFEVPGRIDPIQFLVETAQVKMVLANIRSAVLVGNSLGGHLAVKLALRTPGRVAGLVLCGSSGLFERGMQRTVPRRPDREWLRRKIAEVFFDPRSVTEAMIDEVGRVVHHAGSALKLVRLAQSAKRDNLAAVLPLVRVPVMLIWGADDQITPLETAREFQKLLPASELHVIPRCGHAPMIEAPEEFGELLRRFLCRIQTRSGELPSVAQRAEQEEQRAHSGKDENVHFKVREAAAP